MKKLLLAAAVSALATGAAFADTVRMGTEGAYPPYNFINDKGEVDGFERELGDEICKRAAIDCTWVINEWDSIIPNLVSGNYDTIIAGMSVTAERDEVIDFTNEYIPASPSGYVGLADSSVDVSKGIIAAQTNTIQAGYVATSGGTLVEFATPDETIAAIKNGEADAVLADKDFLAPIVAESNDTLAFVANDVSIGGGVAMGLRESDGALKAKMNSAIDSMKADGTLNTMLAKWFKDNPPQW